MNKRIIQGMAYRQSLTKYAENTVSAAPAESTIKAGLISTSGKRVGMDTFLP